MTNEKVFQMDFGKVYELLLNKAVKKGRTQTEVDEVICWLTGYNTESLEKALTSSVCYGDFFRNAPAPNPNRTLIKGAVCGIRVEEIEDPLIWVCPQCGRSFRRKEQDHYCGKAPETIEEYILSQPEEVQPYLRQVNDAIKGSIPEAKEKISWSMPTYWKGRNLIQFAAFKRHIGLYPGPEAVEVFADQLTDYKTSKGAIQLPYSKPLPLELIGEIAAWCGTNNQK